jgi:hypothetical protein
MPRVYTLVGHEVIGTSQGYLTGGAREIPSAAA